MSTNIFVIGVQNLERSSMYREYLINLPEGLNNPYLLQLIFIGLGIYLVLSLFKKAARMARIRRRRKRLEAFRKMHSQKEKSVTAQKKDPTDTPKPFSEKPGKKAIEKKPQPREIKPVSNAELLEREEKELKLSRVKRLTAESKAPEAEKMQEPLDYSPILEEKRKDSRPKERADGLEDIMANIENKRKNELALKSFEERNNATKQHNIEILDRTVKESLRVEKKE